jgi:hypothetical protein
MGQTPIGNGGAGRIDWKASQGPFIGVLGERYAAFRRPEASENLLRRALDIVRKAQGYPPA